MDYLSASLGLLMEGIQANPAVWLAIFFVSMLGGWLCGLLDWRSLRILATALWATAPVCIGFGWLTWCEAFGDTDPSRCFGQGFALAIELVSLPVWTTAAIVGVLLSRRRKLSPR